MVLPRAEGKTASGKSLPVVRLAPNEVTSYRLTFPGRDSDGATKTHAHETKAGPRIAIVIPNSDTPVGSSSARTPIDISIQTPALPRLQPKPNWLV